jgi:hypothetical protein
MSRPARSNIPPGAQKSFCMSTMRRAVLVISTAIGCGRASMLVMRVSSRNCFQPEGPLCPRPRSKVPAVHVVAQGSKSLCGTLNLPECRPCESSARAMVLAAREHPWPRHRAVYSQSRDTTSGASSHACATIMCKTRYSTCRTVFDEIGAHGLNTVAWRWALPSSPTPPACRVRGFRA